MSCAAADRRLFSLGNGETVMMRFPVVVSASRRTDIPAFHADWFFHRLEIGYSAWKNPYNGKEVHVSYRDTRFIVFWSKNPRPLLVHLDKLPRYRTGCYVQFTLNDYGKEGLEPGVPPLGERIDTFKRLVEVLGPGRVVWRFDPLVLTDAVDTDVLLDRISRIGNRLKGYTESLVFSFADISVYGKVCSNLKRKGIAYREWEGSDRMVFGRRLADLNRQEGWNYRLASCAEEGDLSSFGIARNRCIDDRLIARFSYRDKDLMRYLKVRILSGPDPDLFGITGNRETGLRIPSGAVPLDDGRFAVCPSVKDPGQRPFCGCVRSMDIGQYGSCGYGCVYCYAARGS